MVKLTLPTEEQIWGKNAFDTIKKSGTQHKTTGLVPVLGGIKTADDIFFPSDFAVAWTASSDGSGDVRCVDYYGGKTWGITQTRRMGIRLVIPKEEAAHITLTDIKTDKYGIVTGEFGEYPRSVVVGERSLELKKAFLNKTLIPTGKGYVFDCADPNDEYADCKLKRHLEYLYEGKRYVCVKVRPTDKRLRNFMSPKEISTLRVAEPGKVVFVEVEPIRWSVNEDGSLITNECITAGFQFDPKRIYNGDFEKTFMNAYLRRLAKEIEVVKINEQEQQKVLPSKVAERPSPSKEKNKNKGNGRV